MNVLILAARGLAHKRLCGTAICLLRAWRRVRERFRGSERQRRWLQASLAGARKLPLLSGCLWPRLTVDSGAGNDVLLGGAGDDVLVGGPGFDVLDGGLGDDIEIDDFVAGTASMFEHGSASGLLG